MKPDQQQDDTFIPAPTLTDRQADRMAALPEIYKTPYEQLACELALGMDEPAEILQRYGYSPETGALLIQSREFGAMLGRISKEVHESGLSFKTKVRMQAEALLSHAYLIATDELQPTTERTKLIIWHGKMAGYEPKESDEKVGSSKGGFSLTIQFAGKAPENVVMNQPLTIEQS